MVSLMGYSDAIIGIDPLAQVGGLALDFISRMVPSPLGIFLVLTQARAYSLVTVKADPIMSSSPDRVGNDYLAAIQESDPVNELLRDRHRTNLFAGDQLRGIGSFPGSSLERDFIGEYEFGPLLLLAIWDQASSQHCVIFLARSSGEADFSEREKGFMRHAAPLLTQSYHCAIGIGGLAAPLPATLAAGLTARELEVARLAAQGARNQEIAEHFNIAPGTVKCHMHNVYAKLGMNSRIQLALALGVSK